MQPPALHKLRTIEGLLATIAIGLGLQLAGPAETFNTARGYSAMAALASEATWSAAALAAGLATIIGQGWSFERLKLAGMACLIFFYTFLAAMFLTANPTSTAIPTYTALAAFAVLELIGGRND